MSTKMYTRYVNVWFLLVMVLSVFSMAFVMPTSAEAASPNKQMIKLIKAERKSAGCGKTKKKTKLIRAAKRHSKDMHKNNFFSTTGSDGSTLTTRVQDAGYKGQAAHVLGSAVNADAQYMFESWMDDAVSRELIHDCSFKHIGVSHVRGKWTVILGAKS